MVELPIGTDGAAGHHHFHHGGFALLGFGIVALVLAQLACSAIFPETRRERQPSPPGSDPPENPVCYSLLPVGSIFLNPLFARFEIEG
jgi:hypothetical protein